MGTVQENRKHWGALYHWRDGGEEWSAAWGGSAAQWAHTLAPRIAEFVPAERIVEIGSGYGRWTHFLREHARELVALDLAGACVEACSTRFRDDPRVVCRQTDGSSLSGVADRSVDLVFSFDSLVHAELDTLEAYLREIRRCLTRDGVAFLHHSNFGEVLDQRPGSWNYHWRAESVSAARVAALCSDLQMVCRSQEILTWGEVDNCDCLSVIVLSGGRWERPLRVERNPWFMGEAYSIGVRTRLYGSFSAAGGPETSPSSIPGGNHAEHFHSSMPENARQGPKRGGKQP